VKRRIVIGLTSLGSLFLILWVAAWVLEGSGVPQNTRVLNIEIGSHSKAVAASILRDGLSAEMAKPIQFEAVGQLRKVNPETLGATLDVVATLSAVGSRPINPISLFARTFSERVLPPIIRVDRPRFDRKMENLNSDLAVPIHEGGVSFSGLTPVPIWPSNGQAIDRAKALALFKEQWLRSTVIRIPTILERTRVSAEEIKKVIIEIAYPAVRAPVILNIDGQDLVIDPSKLAYSMSFIPTLQGHLDVHFSSHLLGNSLGGPWLKLVPPAQDAVFKFISGQARVYPSVLGRTISDEILTQVLSPILIATGTDRRASIKTTALQPRITTEDAGGLGIRGQVFKFTTWYPPAAYRIQNIHRAADLMDGTIVKPGDIFSLNKTVGERTAANGFAEGIVIYNGHFAKDFGGGVSQVATTTWNAAWFSGVELVAHMAHSFYISRYPVGREATVAWPNVDLQFRNDTGNLLLMHTTYTNSSLSVALYGTRKYDVASITGPRKNVKNFAIYDDNSPTCIHQDGVVGFDIDVTRILKTAGVEVRREVIHTHYVPEDRISCTNPAAVFGNPLLRRPPKPKVSPMPIPVPSTAPTPTPTNSISPIPLATS
jgi:vancomycin resistance protein YoaR